MNLMKALLVFWIDRLSEGLIRFIFSRLQRFISVQLESFETKFMSTIQNHF